MKKISVRNVSLILLIAVMAIFLGCGNSGQSSNSNPVVEALRGKDKATLQAAAANVRTVKSALIGYQAQSSDGLYPRTFDIYGYDDLRKLLPQANLPLSMDALKWDPTAGIQFDSDGTTFSFSVTALTSNKETITATPQEVTINR